MAQSTLTQFQILPRPRWRGFSFALHRHGAGLFFLPGGVSASRNRLRLSFCRQCNYTTTAPKPFTGLYRGFSVDLPYFSAYNTAAAQAAYTPPAPRRRAYHQAQHLHRYQIPPTHWTLYRATQPPIIIRYIKVQWCVPVMDPCPAVQHSTDYSAGGGSVHPACIRCMGQLGGWRSGTGSAARAHTPPGGAVQRQGRRGTVDGYRRIPFRAFAR